MLRTFLLAVLVASSAAAITPDADQVIRKSVEAIQADWAQAPKFSYLERDVESKHHSPRLAKTYRVLMIDGSPYNLVTAINDEPLSSNEASAEQRKLRKEIEKRRNDSDRERSRRIAKYDKDRGHEHEMLKEMVQAFQFHPAGEAQVDGRACWVLNAEPKPGFAPSDHEGRVLKGMKGTLWIDKASNQWVRVHAEVVKPVSFFGFLAKVGPGTEFDLRQAPVMDNIWMPTRFDVQVHSTALGFVNEDSTDSETYRDYQLMPQASALLQSTQ